MKRQYLISLILLNSIISLNAQWVTNPDGTTKFNTLILSNDNVYNSVINSGGVAKMDMGFDGAKGYVTFGAHTGNGYRNNILYLRGNDGNVGIGFIDPMNKLSILAKDAGDGIFLTHANYTDGAKDWRITSGIVGYSHEHFAISSGSDVRFTINGNNGYVGVGTKCPQYKLDVIGTIRADEVKVDLTRGCDFVFKSDYKLMELIELEEFIKANQHLPEVASEKEMVENGVNMKELQMKLLQKVEELTLYTIEQNKKIIELEKQNAKIKALEEKIEKMELTSK